MIPQGRLSSVTLFAPFMGARGDSGIGPILDREDGGIALNDPSEGLLYQPWLGVCDGVSITLSAPNTAPVTWITGAEISEFSFSFDQNMRPAVAYVEAGIAKLNWFDVAVNQQVTTVYDDTYRNPRMSLDDKHRLASDTSDVIFAYLRGGSLYYRQQRDRYLTEYLLASGVQGRLNRIGLNRQNRMQFELVIES